MKQIQGQNLSIDCDRESINIKIGCMDYQVNAVLKTVSQMIKDPNLFDEHLM